MIVNPVNNRLYSSSITVWDLENYKEITFLTDHSRIRCLTISDNYLYSGSYDDIKVWNLTTHEEIASFPEQARCLICKDNYLYSGSDKNLSIWDLTTKKKIKSIPDTQMLFLKLIF